MAIKTAPLHLQAMLALALAGLLSAADAGSATQARVTASYSRIPMSFESCFEAMCGEAGSQVKFFSRNNGYHLFLAPTEAVLHDGLSRKPKLRIRLLRSNSNPRIEGLDPLPGKSNYFVGKNAKNWRTDVTNYARVRYQNVYPGVDLVYYGNGSHLEYDFVVTPGGDPRAIALTFPDAGSIRIDQQGDLVLNTDNGPIVQRKPVIWQQIGAKKKRIAGRYALRNKNEVRFELGRYDTGAALVIDPVLVYSTFLGSYGRVAVDAASNAYVTGWAGDRGTSIMKLDPTGATVIYSTYIGGAASNVIALDAAGNVYLTGVATPSEFPTTPGAYQTQPPIGSPPFITKVNSTGSALDYSTYLSPPEGASLSGGPQSGPGPSFVLACCIAVDSAGSAYVAGITRSKNFPTTPGSFQPRLDATWGTFVTKLNPTGTTLSYSTYLGGGGPGVVLTGRSQETTAIAVDAAGNAYVAGWTGAADFPTTPGALQLPGTFRFSFGGFVTKLNPAGSALVYSSVLREALPVTAMTVDPAGNVYVAGYNLTGEFPTTPGAFNAGAGRTAWLAKLNDAGSALVYSSHIVPEGEITKIAVDAGGNATVVGRTSSRDFPTTPGGFQKAFGGGHSFAEEGTDSDAFVTKLNAAGTALIYSTYLGGKGDESIVGLALDAAGNAYVTGTTDSPDFPITGAALQTASTTGAFLMKLELPDTAVVPSFQPSRVLNGASFLPGPVAPGEIIALFGTGFGPASMTTLQLNAGFADTRLGGTRVLFDGVPAPLVYAVENQLSAVVPYALAGKSATQLQVEYRGARSAPVTLQLAPASPGIFTLDSSGKGPGAILNQDSSLNSQANPARVGSLVSIFATGEGQTSPAGIDGKPSSQPPARPILPVTVTIGGQTVLPSYAGAAPGKIAGLLQINVTIPGSIETGSAVPVVVQVGNASSQAGVTIAVQ